MKVLVKAYENHVGTVIEHDDVSRFEVRDDRLFVFKVAPHDFDGVQMNKSRVVAIYNSGNWLAVMEADA